MDNLVIEIKRIKIVYIFWNSLFLGIFLKWEINIKIYVWDFNMVLFIIVKKINKLWNKKESFVSNLMFEY